MSDLDLTALHIQLAGFKQRVEANRAESRTRLARIVHDRLLDHLDGVMRICRNGTMAAKRLQRNTDRAKQEGLEFALGNWIADLMMGGRGSYPWPLLDEIIIESEMVFHPHFAIWCQRSVLDQYEVTDEELNGLRTIIDRITQETGIRFTTYLCEGQEEGTDGPIYILRNGGRYRVAL